MKVLLVDFEQRVLRSISRMIQSEIDDWEIRTAQSGPDALELLQSENVNVIVSDLGMPGMGGAELLSLVEQRHPNVFRIVLSGRADREAVLSAVQPMHRYLSKPCDPQILIRMIKRAEIFQKTIASPTVLDAIGKANALPSPSSIVSKMWDELDNEHWNAHSVAGIIEQDPLLSARILQVANSAIFALQKPVLDLEQAVSLVGRELIQSLAMWQALLPETPDPSSVFCTHSLFAHSLEVAVLARELSQRLNRFEADVECVFSGALLHDVGKLILLNAFPDRYSRLAESAPLESGPLWQAELDELGASHQGVGAYLLELWGLPRPLVESVAAHHSLDLCVRSGVGCQIVYGANWLGNGGDEAHLRNEVEMANRPELAAKFARTLLNWKSSRLEPVGSV